MKWWKRENRREKGKEVRKRKRRKWTVGSLNQSVDWDPNEFDLKFDSDGSRIRRSKIIGQIYPISLRVYIKKKKPIMCNTDNILVLS